MRECNTCHISKPLSEYHRAPHLREFKTYKCKSCARAYNQVRYWSNPEQHRQQKAAYVAANHDRIRKEHRASEINYYERNKTTRNRAFGERVKVRRRTDPVYRQKLIDRSRTHYLKRYGCKIGLEALFDSQLGRCANQACNRSLKDGCHVDHIMPVALGGSNDLRNLQFLCPNCNHRKTKRHPDEWEQTELKRLLL